MQKITKKEFKAIYKNLSLIQGMIHLPKKLILKKLNSVTNIKPYLKKVSNYGNIGSDVTGYQKTDVYQSGPFIFLETIIDHSKNKNSSRTTQEFFNTVYYKGLK